MENPGSRFCCLQGAPVLLRRPKSQRISHQQRADLSAVTPGKGHCSTKISHRRKTMKTAFRLMLASLMFLGTASLVKAQSPAVTHNTWTSGAPMPVALEFTMAGVIGSNIYVVGGITDTAVV